MRSAIFLVAWSELLESVHSSELIVILLVLRHLHNPADLVRELIPDELFQERIPHVGPRRHARRRPGVPVHGPSRVRNPLHGFIARLA